MKRLVLGAERCLKAKILFGKKDASPFYNHCFGLPDKMRQCFHLPACDQEAQGYTKKMPGTQQLRTSTYLGMEKHSRPVLGLEREALMNPSLNNGGERRSLVCPLPSRISKIVPSWGHLFGTPCPKALLERLRALSLWQAPKQSIRNPHYAIQKGKAASLYDVTQPNRRTRCLRQPLPSLGTQDRPLQEILSRPTTEF